MRFTALPPPPPTPITLILASLRGSSLKLMRMLESFVIFPPDFEFSSFVPYTSGQKIMVSKTDLDFLTTNHCSLMPDH
jgi:hypothetical protein